MEESKVSVIIPCYNVEKYVDQAVQSVLSQTYTNIEIILVDDGSTDGTADICDRYAEEYDFIQVIHQENKGLSCARNVGIEQSAGEYVYFLDSDDWISSAMVQSVIEKIAFHEADMLFFDAYTTDEGGKVLEDNLSGIKPKLEESVKSGEEWFKIMIDQNNFFACVPFHVYKKSFLLQNNLKFYPSILHEDELFSFYAYLNAKKVLRDSGIYYFRRLRSSSIMGNPNYYLRFTSKQLIMNYVMTQSAEQKNQRNNLEMAALFLKRFRGVMLFDYFHMAYEERKSYEKSLKQTLRKYGHVLMKQKNMRELIFILKAYWSIFRCNKVVA